MNIIHVEADEVLQHVAEAVIVTDLQGVIAYWNTAAERIYGWSAEEARGQPIAELLQTEYFAGDREHAREVLDQRDLWREDVVQHHRSGRRIIIAASVKFLYRDGERIGMVAVNRDVTRMRELERDVLRVAKLESIAFVAGGVAHDVKNMLSGAMGLAELISRRLGDDPNAELARKMKESLRDAAALSARMVAYSRTSGVSIEAFDLNERLHAIEELLTRLLPPTCELELDTADDELPIRLESGQLDQIVMNLIVNARDAMPDGGVIRIDTGLEMDGDPPMSYARLTVRDDGHGMDEETLSKLFEPYFTTKPAGLGTGFGMATVRDIVRRYHGSVDVESSAGEGTTVTVRLPLAPEAQDAMTRRG